MKVEPFKSGGWRVQYPYKSFEPALVNVIERVIAGLPRNLLARRCRVKHGMTIDYSAQVQKIEVLKLHKKGLMQGFFPNNDEVNI
ncbi:hypothetical protein [Hydromonas duriensis]|uniref:Uncharacterized protein n=1 Tax=Hydromonas duriensis TaxID=1527608 RepID=A0A4R6Y2U8_9BURK|nr:hypothetical protein [Hydromonas duriensis]TDR30674.1 hypothetical protein DFR44_11821 [Hydromonas duriensis]